MAKFNVGDVLCNRLDPTQERTVLQVKQGYYRVSYAGGGKLGLSRHYVESRYELKTPMLVENE